MVRAVVCSCQREQRMLLVGVLMLLVGVLVNSSTAGAVVVYAAVGRRFCGGTSFCNSLVLPHTTNDLPLLCSCHVSLFFFAPALDSD